MGENSSAPHHIGSATRAVLTPERRHRRHLLVRAALRVIATTVLLLGLYFQLPIGQGMTAWAAVALVASLIAFAAVAYLQIRRIVDAPLPGLRAVETLVTIIPVFVVIFALVYVTLYEVDPDSFNRPITRITGLYFTVTVFTTVGFGDVVAQTDAARAVVTLQMLLDLAILGGLVQAIIGASRIGLERRRAEADQATEQPTERPSPH